MSGGVGQTQAVTFYSELTGGNPTEDKIDVFYFSN
jgi:hypothetical protein